MSRRDLERDQIVDLELFFLRELETEIEGARSNLLGYAASPSDDSECLAALAGGPGSGKTLVVRVLATRLADAFEPAVVPYPALEPPGTQCVSLHGLCGVP